MPAVSNPGVVNSSNATEVGNKKLMEGRSEGNSAKQNGQTTIVNMPPDVSSETASVSSSNKVVREKNPPLSAKVVNLEQSKTLSLNVIEIGERKNILAKDKTGEPRDNHRQQLDFAEVTEYSQATLDTDAVKSDSVSPTEDSVLLIDETQCYSSSDPGSSSILKGYTNSALSYDSVSTSSVESVDDHDIHIPGYSNFCEGDGVLTEDVEVDMDTEEKENENLGQEKLDASVKDSSEGSKDVHNYMQAALNNPDTNGASPNSEPSFVMVKESIKEKNAEMHAKGLPTENNQRIVETTEL